MYRRRVTSPFAAPPPPHREPDGDVEARRDSRATYSILLSIVATLPAVRAIVSGLSQSGLGAVEDGMEYAIIGAVVGAAALLVAALLALASQRRRAWLALLACPIAWVLATLVT